MKSRSNNPAFNREWKDHGKGYNKQDYVPLTEREDWDGKVEKLPTKKEAPQATSPEGQKG